MQLHDVVQVLREVDDDGGVDRLPRQSGPAAPRQQRNVVISADLDRGDDGIGGAGDDHANGYLPEDRRVVGVHRARPGVETDLPIYAVPQLTHQAAEFHSVGRLDRTGLRRPKGHEPGTSASHSASVVRRISARRVPPSRRCGAVRR